MLTLLMILMSAVDCLLNFHDMHHVITGLKKINVNVTRALVVETRCSNMVTVLLAISPKLDLLELDMSKGYTSTSKITPRYYVLS